MLGTDDVLSRSVSLPFIDHSLDAMARIAVANGLGFGFGFGFAAEPVIGMERLVQGSSRIDVSTI